MSRMSKPHPSPETCSLVAEYVVPHTDITVLMDTGDGEYPIAIHGANWWLTKTQTADLITTLLKALQDAP